MLDVGAHHGSSLASFARAGWTVHAFEPDTTNRSALEQRWGDEHNVRIDPRAVSNEIKHDVPFYASAESTGISSLSAFQPSHELAGTVSTTTLATYCDEHNVDRVDFLKIDAEGHDLFVLQGVPWETLSPGVIVCEFEESKTLPLGYGFTDLADYLIEKGYVVYVSEWYPVRRYGISHDWRELKRYPCALTTEQAWGNLIAYKDGPPSTDAVEQSVRKAMQFGNRRNIASVETAAKSFLYQPTFSNTADLQDQLARAAFYLTSLELERVYFIVDGEIPTSFVEPQGMDPGIARMAEELWPRISFVAAGDQSAVDAAMEASDVVFRWRDPEKGADEPAQLKDKKTWLVDKRTRRMEGSLFVEAAFRSQPDMHHLIMRNQQALTRLVKKLGRSDAAYVFGTGPSASRYDEFDFSNGVSIVCNTIIKDEELMDHVRPDILVFADPIFHFGCSQYAASFRELACKAAEKYDLAIVIPIKYYAHLTWLCPELEKRIVGVPFDKKLQVNTDLTKKFHVPPIDNILTLLLLPVAATFSDDIQIIGCDGRDPTEKGKFWSHNAKTQLGDLMQNIKDVHPGFFKLDYEDYYQRHCDNLEHWIATAEDQGVYCTSMVESKIPALRSRMRPDLAKLAEMLATAKPYRIVSINPDAEGQLGHFGPHDARIREQVQAQDADFVSLANRANTDEHSNEWVFPLFTDNSWSALSRNRGVLDRFARQLSGAFQTIEQTDPDTKNVFMMYLGSVQHLVALLEAARHLRPSHNTIIVNLFWAHAGVFKPIDKLVVEELAYTLRHTRALRELYNVRLVADTPILVDAIERHSGEKLPLWPMFGVSDLGDLNEAVGRSGQIRVLCPSTLQYAKGYDLLPPMIQGLAKDRRLRFVVREVYQSSTPDPLRRMVKPLYRDAEVLEGHLSPAEYAREVKRADIIVIPYRKETFYGRTSGVLADAIQSGTPIVCTRETWAGRCVDSLGIGATFRDGNVDELSAAVSRVVDNLDEYRSRVNDERVEWVAQNSPEKFLSFLRELGAEPAASDDDARAAMERQMLDLLPDALNYRRALATVAQDSSSDRPEERFAKVIARRNTPATRTVEKQILLPRPLRNLARGTHSVMIDATERLVASRGEDAKGARKLRKFVRDPGKFFRDATDNWVDSYPGDATVPRKVRKLLRNPRKFVVDARKKKP